MRLSTSIIGLLILCSAAASSQRAPVRRTEQRVLAGSRNRPIYTSDERVVQNIRLPDQVESLESFLNEVGSQSGLVLLADPILRNMKLVFSSEEQRVSAVLGQVAVLTSAEWFRFGDRYVLARDP